MNNPPAFPRSFSNETLASNGTTQRGMTLRDYFAAKAMQARLPRMLHSTEHTEIARQSYSIADAMLKAREQ